MLLIIVGLIAGTICALVANQKGRNPIGWFFLGFFFGLFGVIASLVVSNLNEFRQREESMEIEQKRLREQLHQERIKTEKLRQYTQMRLDIHDKELKIDTRNIGHLLDSKKDQELFGNIKEAPKNNYPRQADDLNTELDNG